MADQFTHGDAIRLYLAGASGSDGSAQTDPAASFGDFRSSTLINALDFSASDPGNLLDKLAVLYLAGANGPGTGLLEAINSDDIRWTPPAGSAGPAVTIADSEFKVVEGSGELDKFALIERTDAASLPVNTVTMTITEVLNNVLGQTNITPAEQATGKVTYAAIVIKNHSVADVANLAAFIDSTAFGTQRVSDVAQLAASGTGTIESGTASAFADWPQSGFCRIVLTGGTTLREIIFYSSRTDTVLTVSQATDHRGLLGSSLAAGAATDLLYPVPGLRIAVKAPSSQPTGNFDVIIDETDSTNVLTAYSWNSFIDKVNGEVIGTLAATNIYAIWIERTVVPGQTSQANLLNAIDIQADAA